MKVDIFKSKKKELRNRVKELEDLVNGMENELKQVKEELEEERIRRAKVERELYRERKQRITLEINMNNNNNNNNNDNNHDEGTGSPPRTMFLLNHGNGGGGSGGGGGGGGSGHQNNNVLLAPHVFRRISRGYPSPMKPPVYCDEISCSLHDVLDVILRPFHEDEVWCITREATVLLTTLHSSNSFHGNINLNTIRVGKDGSVYLGQSLKQVSSKFIPLEVKSSQLLSPAADVFGLGVTLWSCADFLLEPEEEPDLNDDICALIGRMTEDNVSGRPSSFQIANETEKYSPFSQKIMKAIMEEVERKRAIRKEFEEEVVERHREIFKVVITEMTKGVELKHIDPEKMLPPIRAPNLREELAKIIKGFEAWKVSSSSSLHLPLRRQLTGIHTRSASQHLKTKFNGSTTTFVFSNDGKLQANESEEQKANKDKTNGDKNNAQ